MINETSDLWNIWFMKQMVYGISANKTNDLWYNWFIKQMTYGVTGL